MSQLVNLAMWYVDCLSCLSPLHTPLSDQLCLKAFTNNLPDKSSFKVHTYTNNIMVMRCTVDYIIFLKFKGLTRPGAGGLNYPKNRISFSYYYMD